MMAPHRGEPKGINKLVDCTGTTLTTEDDNVLGSFSTETGVYCLANDLAGLFTEVGRHNLVANERFNTLDGLATSCVVCVTLGFDTKRCLERHIAADHVFGDVVQQFHIEFVVFVIHTIIHE
ncbi:hypothetical protein PsorP6_011653 [Peronosclerospora sorghi]|uniref:Uncharacterized protein n=1 Tax=Peronosclerospora sorghi TaxID=230839 RepID=A0ACC0WKD7_9STRA|nr:hypothetical protein PsorP6_011653 [Peronosclerospora sorghi]